MQEGKYIIFHVNLLREFSSIRHNLNYNKTIYFYNFVIGQKIQFSLRLNFQNMKLLKRKRREGSLVSRACVLGQEVVGSIPTPGTRSLLIGSVSV